jgi:L-rhamnonate dehydratase
VPLEKTVGYPGMVVPKEGWCVPSNEPGFGHGLTLDAISAMSI